LINADEGGGSPAPGGGAGVAGGGAVAAAGGAAVPAGLLAVVPVPLLGVEVPLFEQAVRDSATITATEKARNTHTLLMMRTERRYSAALSVRRRFGLVKRGRTGGPLGEEAPDIGSCAAET
jgi:hypothetical protein